MPIINEKWIGPTCVGVGGVMLIVQVFAFIEGGLLDSLLIGGGIGLVAVGAAAWYYYLDDGWSKAALPSDDNLPTADEYDRQLEELEPDADEYGKHGRL